MLRPQPSRTKGGVLLIPLHGRPVRRPIKDQLRNVFHLDRTKLLGYEKRNIVTIYFYILLN
jgi:hypothetical protein